MNLTLTFNETNVAQMTVFAQLMSQCNALGISFSFGGIVSNNTNTANPVVSTPVKPVKEYAPAEDVQSVWVVDGTHVSYTTTDGKYVGQTAVRKTLNARLREAGAKYDTEKKIWSFTTKAKAEEFAKISALVTAEQINAVRAKAKAREEKKNA